MSSTTLAGRLRDRDPEALREASHSVLVVRPDNLVARPWGGRRLCRWKEIAAPDPAATYGEVFEISADRRDAESAAHPSIVRLQDASEMTLPDLLDRAGPEILGEELFAEAGPNLPLLPKTLDIEQLLSVQAHPPGSPEAYYVLEADPGATMRVGFARDLERDGLRSTFQAGREAQESLLESLREDVDGRALQQVFGRAFTQGCDADGLLRAARPFLADGIDEAEVRVLLTCLEGAWRQALALMTEVPAIPGTVVFNATPPSEEGPRSAEVHALGNPEQRGILLLEIRRPAPTWRAWDHVRFPLRELEIDRAVETMRLGARTAASLVVEPRPLPDRPGAFESAACEAFVVEHLRPMDEASVTAPADPSARTLHCVAGHVEVTNVDGRPLARLRRGESALVPAALGSFAVRGFTGSAEVLCVRLPRGTSA